MRISAFSYVRNGFKYGYPFLQSIQSILPICDEFIIAVGDSEDGTREAIVNIGNPKIKIIDTIWDEQLRTNGKIFAQQANIALEQITGDWAFHIQADEVIHEKDLNQILEQINLVNENPKVEGLLFDFLNFHGSYSYLNGTRNQHKKEIRIFRNNINVFSFRDSQGFRKYPSKEEFMQGHKGLKLKVKYIKTPVYHYSYVRHPEQMNNKSKFFETFWHDDNYVESKYQSKNEFDYYDIEKVLHFEGTHPSIMEETIKKEDWNFDPNKINKALSFKEKLIYWVEGKLNYRIGEYKNYTVI